MRIKVGKKNGADNKIGRIFICFRARPRYLCFLEDRMRPGIAKPENFVFICP